MYTNKSENSNLPLEGISPVIVSVIGLSKKEKAVLGTVLRMQMGGNVSKIAKRAKMPRTTTLYILDKLKKRNLVFRTLHGKIYWWRYKRGLEYMVRSRKKQGLIGTWNRENKVLGSEDRHTLQLSI